MFNSNLRATDPDPAIGPSNTIKLEVSLFDAMFNISMFQNQNDVANRKENYLSCSSYPEIKITDLRPPCKL